MHSNFIEPEFQLVSIDTIKAFLESLPISAKNRKWLLDLLSQNGIPIEMQGQFEKNLNEIVTWINKIDPKSFKLLFLFASLYNRYEGSKKYAIDILEIFPDCFATEKFYSERINVISDLFIKQEGKPEVLKPFVAHILAHIHAAEDLDAAFSKAYRQKLQKVRNASTFEEISRYYMRLILQSLPKQEYDGKLVTSFSDEEFYKSEAYQLIRLFAEMEGMREEEELYIRFPLPYPPISIICDITAIPFLLCGKEQHAFVRNVLFFLLKPRREGKGFSDEQIAQMAVPQDKANFDRCLLFLKNMKHLSQKDAEDKFVSFYQSVSIQGVFNSIAREEPMTEADWREKADTLWKEFVDIFILGDITPPPDREISFVEKIAELLDILPVITIGDNSRHYPGIDHIKSPKDFLDYLLSSKKPLSSFNDNERPLKLIQSAYKSGILTKEMVLEGQTAYLIPFYERAIQETEPACAELDIFLQLWNSRDTADAVYTLFVNHPERLNNLNTRCSKTLRCISVGQIKYDYSLTHLVANFVLVKTANAWKALKPLLLAFRNSKTVQVKKDLGGSVVSLFDNITFFFTKLNREKLKELRQDMANDFLEYLKPAKKIRQAGQYTEFERNAEGFDLSYTEPSPFWRYAYCRALSDLGVKTDGRGHFFKKVLEEVSKKDPSEKVKGAAKKTFKELDEIRRGYIGSNHKKCLFEAFWWIRYAHMLSLGAEIDQKEALVRRIKEWR